MTTLSGKTTLVAGASRNTGRASVLAPAAAGARVLVRCGYGIKEADGVFTEIRNASAGKPPPAVLCGGRAMKRTSPPLDFRYWPRSCRGSRTGECPLSGGQTRHREVTMSCLLMTPTRTSAWRPLRFQCASLNSGGRYATVGRRRSTSSSRSAIALRSPERCRSRHRWKSPSNSA